MDAVDVAALEVRVAVAIPGRGGVGVEDVEGVAELGREALGLGDRGGQRAETALVELVRRPVRAAVLRGVHARVLKAAASEDAVERRREVGLEDVGDGDEKRGIQRVG